MSRELKGTLQEGFVPQVNLTRKEGSFVKGKLVDRLIVGEHKQTKYIFELIDTDASVTRFNPEKKIQEEVTVKTGDRVAVWGATLLNDKMSEALKNDVLTITYLGVGKKGSQPKPPFLFRVIVD